ncbi:MAG: hypothetical protein JKY56_09665 [Kofleriaceae bacterium]|nr:hypothetical protein [Kofleriaceae bacterium]
MSESSSIQSPLPTVYGSLLITRPPVPATLNKAGANYKSEVAHLEYSPKRAFDEWRRICETIVKCGGDALFAFEECDEKYLDASSLRVDGDGQIYADDSKVALGNISEVQTGRVFTANGPWVHISGKKISAVMQHMLPHRVLETSYYTDLLEAIAKSGGYTLSVTENPHRWEGMADITVVGDKVVLTYAVSGHYDEATTPKSGRSTLAGVTFAADTIGIPESARIYAELIYPHFHGDTVHYGLRNSEGKGLLAHYAGGLWGEGSSQVCETLGAQQILTIGKDDAVEQYAGNSRQVLDGVLVPDKVSDKYQADIEAQGLSCYRVPLFELFGKAGGGPGCATLYMPSNLELPENAPMRFSQQSEAVATRRERLPDKLTVAPEFFEGRSRG